MWQTAARIPVPRSLNPCPFAVPQCRLAGIPLAALFVPGLAAAAGSCERLVATGNPEYPLYPWRDPQDPKRLIGANADLLQRLGKELGVRIDVLYSGSWEKAQEEVTSGRADLLAGAYLTLARLGSMDYVHPLFLMTSGVVWVNKDAAFPFIGRDDLIGHKGQRAGRQQPGREFDRFAKASLDLKPVPSLTQGLQDLMPQAQRVPPLPGVARAGPGRGAGHGRRPEALEPVLSSEGLYLTLSHNSACNDPWLRGQLAKKMTELSAAGVPVTLLQDNLERWKAQQLPASGASSTTQESDL